MKIAALLFKPLLVVKGQKEVKLLDYRRHSSNYVMPCLIILLGVFFLLTPWANNVSCARIVDPHTVPADSTTKASPYQPVYHINLQVHLDHSARKPRDFLPIFQEINEIWRSQAGICFDIHAVRHDTPLDDGLDMWFSPDIGGFNGYYDGEVIQMTDTPILENAPHPAHFTTARTAAHELGHALGLHHRQNSDDNLMRSKTRGWQLNQDEIIRARRAATALAIAATPQQTCPPANFDQIARKQPSAL